MSQNFQTWGDIPSRVGVQAVGRALAHAEFENVVTKFAKIFPFSDNKGQVIRFRRRKPFAISTVPLVEGITPAPTAYEQEIVDFRIQQFGALYRVSDWVVDLHEDPILNDISEEAGVQATHTREFVMWGYVRSGTQVIYEGGVAGRDDIVAPISLESISAAVNLLERNMAKPVTEMIKAGPGIGTEPIGHGWVGLGHVDQRFDFEEMDSFVPYYRYGSANNLVQTSRYEIGAVRGNVRIFLAPHLVYFPNAGDAVGQTGMRSDNGTNVNVYPFVIFGRDAIGAIPMKGMNTTNLTVRRPTMGDDSDPLGQRATVAWKFWFTGGILNPRWIVRIEAAASALGG